jgi:hypothetical protein
LPASGITGAGTQTVSSFTTSQLEVPVERYATFGHAYYDVTESLRLFLEGSYGHVDFYASTYARRRFSKTILCAGRDPRCCRGRDAQSGGPAAGRQL